MPLSQSGHLPRGQRHCSQSRGSASSEESSQLRSDLIPRGRGTLGRPGQRRKPAIGSPPVPSIEILSSARPLGQKLWPTIWPGLSDVIVLISCFSSPCSSWCKVQASILGAAFSCLARHQGSPILSPQLIPYLFLCSRQLAALSSGLSIL